MGVTQQILVVDDNVELTSLLSLALNRYGYVVTVENRSEYAFDLIRRTRPSLVLLDVMMPVVDGGMILSAIRNDIHLRFLPVILMTGLGAAAEGLCCTGGVETPIIAKPVALKSLIQLIEQVLHTSYAERLPQNVGGRGGSGGGQPTF
ncbi:MAG: response regulator [Verrucomicrobiota bacterium]